MAQLLGRPVNQDLAALFVEQFLADDEFGLHGFEYQIRKYKKVNAKRQFIGIATEWCSGDPWWWPKENGQELEDWGLSHHHPGADDPVLNRVLASLRGGLSRFESGTRRREAWRGFPGSLSAGVGCCLILSTRPSVGEFPSANTIKLYDVIAATWPDERFLEFAHVTDLAKFRGPTQDSKFEE